MLSGYRILAVVPARGGSKGVPLKNLRLVLGVPLVALVGRVVRGLPFLDRVVVSTDHEETAAVAERAGISAPFRRPPELSGDRIGDWEVLHHALLETERIDGVRYDLTVMLQPTCPLRKADHVEQAVRFLIDRGHDSVWTVSRADIKYHPLKALRVRGGHLSHYDPKGPEIKARQQLDQTYYRNGAAYVLTRSCIVEQKTTMGVNAGACILDDPMVSIDTEEDFRLVEELLKHRGMVRLKETGDPPP
jgi:CMP-N-acetylneuraminic acid synthetase